MLWGKSAQAALAGLSRLFQLSSELSTVGGEGIERRQCGRNIAGIVLYPWRGQVESGTSRIGGSRIV
jgi:hypothetical protein